MHLLSHRLYMNLPEMRDTSSIQRVSQQTSMEEIQRASVECLSPVQWTEQIHVKTTSTTVVTSKKGEIGALALN